MKIALINDIHIGPALEHKGSMRASSHLVEGILPQVIDQIIDQHSPNILINMGDLIRSESLDLDIRRYQTAVRHFNRASCSVIHLIGNHELKRLSTSHIEQIWKEEGFHQKSYGFMKIGNLLLVWLGMESDSKKIHQLPQEQLEWLKKRLSEENLPALVFTHCAVDDHDVSGNYFYERFKEKQRQGFFLDNQKIVQEAIGESGMVKAVFQAHLHYFHTKMIGKIPYVTCPAMADNICGPNMINNIPEVYTILTFNAEQLSVKVFSREYCFAGTEIPLI